VNTFYRLFASELFSPHQDVSHGFNVSVAIFSVKLSRVSTRISVIWMPSRSKPHSGITRLTVIFIIGNDADSGSICFANGIEPFSITV